MEVRHMMTRNVQVAHSDTPLWEAAEAMRRLNVGSLPVCDDMKVIGMITDRDITVRATADGLDPRSARVGQCMSLTPVCCFEDQETEEAERLMQDAQVRRIPVLDHEMNLVGIVSLADFAIRTVDTEETERTLWKVSQP